MKKISILLCYLLIGFSANSQNVFNIFLRFKYSVTYKEYLSGNYRNDLFNLDVASKVSLFYSHIKSQRDSMMLVLKSEGYSGQAMMLELNERGYSQGANNIVLRDITNMKTTDYNIIASRYYSTSVDTKKLIWKITTDSINILEYKCIKAVTNFAGRQWIVWFAPDIPANYGPWKLNGLPGAILKAHDSEDYYTFDCVGISKMNIIFDSFMFKKYKEIEKDEYTNLLYKFKRNPIQYYENQNGYTLRGHHKDGTPIDMNRYKNLPYNPIERE